MKFRFDRRGAAAPLPFSGRYLTRLVIMTGFCVAFIVALNLPKFRGRGAAGSTAPESAPAPIQTAMAPSPFGSLGLGVIVADDRPKEVQEPPGPITVPPGDSELAPVDRELLEHVLDKTEDLAKRPYYHLLTLAATARGDLLVRHARRDVKFQHLWEDPEAYRGELIFLDGYLRGIRQGKAADDAFFNPARVETLYEGYLLTHESRPNAYVVVVPRLADGMPVGMNIAENASFAGYFLKLWRYTAADGTERAAPLLIGQLISWTPSPPLQRDSRFGAYLAGSFIVLLGVVAGSIWWVSRRAARSPAGAADGQDGGVRESLAELERRGTPDSIESLDDLRDP